MIAVRVQRPPADRQGPDITDNLIVGAPGAIERGRVEIDRNCSSRVIDTRSIVPVDGLWPGMMVLVDDVELGLWRGMLRSVSLACAFADSGMSSEISVTIEREAA